MLVTSPDVYIEEGPGGARTITGASTSDTAFVDFFASGPLDEAMRITSFTEFETTFGGVDSRSEASYAIQQYFLNGGGVAWVVRVSAAHQPASSEWISAEGAAAILGRGGARKGIYALSGANFNLLCLPAAAQLSPASLKSVYDEAAKFCNDERAFLIVDIPPGIDTPKKASDWLDATRNPDAITRDKNAAIYFPRLTMADPLNQNQPRNVGPSGTLAGLYARTDVERGVWKAPAGITAPLRGVNLTATLTDAENGLINPIAINALRSFPAAGTVCWGARTLDGADLLASEWKYIPVRRTALFIENSFYEGSEWVTFEPNAEPLWAQIRLSFGAFMETLFRQGAFQGAKPSDAYFINCDRNTMTQDDIVRGIVNIEVGCALVRPAEFVIIRIQLITSSAIV